jgi:hypothetical protein
LTKNKSDYFKSFVSPKITWFFWVVCNIQR